MKEGKNNFVLYRHYDDNGKLLYIGISGSFFSRTAAHLKASAWAESVATITLERFPSRAKLKRAEIVAIAAENPAHNVMRPEPLAVRAMQISGMTKPRRSGSILALAARAVRIDSKKEMSRVSHMNQSYIWDN